MYGSSEEYSVMEWPWKDPRTTVVVGIWEQLELPSFVVKRGRVKIVYWEIGQEIVVSCLY